MSLASTAAAQQLRAEKAHRVSPGTFEPGNHFYPRVLNAQIHPLVGFFLRMGNERITERYCHLNPRVDRDVLLDLLSTPTEHLRWSGADCFCTTTASGNRRLTVIETNSCPSGNKSMPLLHEEAEQAGYRTVIEAAFLPTLQRRGVADGKLAVVFDKNFTEASGYAAAMADATAEEVLLAPWVEKSDCCQLRDGLLHVRDEDGRHVPVRAAFRYVTQRPWNRIPIRTKTRITNPVIACLAGGRNKSAAAKAYDLYNAELETHGLRICTPETIAGVSLAEVPLWVQRFGGQAVVKVPYSNAGQGVFPILGEEDLRKFRAIDHGYERFVVQSLIGNYSWSSEERSGRFYHVGTMPDRHGHIYVADLRMMVCSGPAGFTPVAVYARRAQQPLPRQLTIADDAWAILGTNLSTRTDEGGWAAETDRLLLMDRKDFNKVGIGGDDLIEAYVQTVLCTRAIDRMCGTLLTKKGELRYRLFASLSDDAALQDEVLSPHKEVSAA